MQESQPNPPTPRSNLRKTVAMIGVVGLAVFASIRIWNLSEELAERDPQTTYMIERIDTRYALQHYVTQDEILGFTQPLDREGNVLRSPDGQFRTHPYAKWMYRYLVAPYRLDETVPPTQDKAIALIRFEADVDRAPGAMQRKILVNIQPGVFLIGKQ